METSLDQLRLNFNPDNLWLLNLCLAIMMFGVALELKGEDFKRIVQQPKASLVGLFTQFVLTPALTFLFVLVLRPSPSVALGMILVAACPGGNISNMMTHLAKGNTALAVSLTAVGTVIAIFMTPFNLQLWGSLYEPSASILREVHLDVLDVLKAILMLAGIPLALGMALNRYKPVFSAKLSKYVKPFSIFIFVVFIVVAFASNFSHFVNYIHYVLLLVLLHNGMALGAGFLTARLAGLSFRDQKTITIETGIHNAGLGLFLIFSFFDGLGGMALVAAWWGIWHIISGMAISLYWSKSTESSSQIA